MDVVDGGTIFSGRPGSPTAICCFPSLARLDERTLLVSARVGSSKDSADGRVLVWRSTDNGRSWHPPVDPFRPATGHPFVETRYAPLAVLGEGRVLAAIMAVGRDDPAAALFNPSTEGLLPCRTFFSDSFDAGTTWGPLREMDDAPYRSPMPLTGPVLVFSDGRIACQFEVNKSYDDPRPWRHAAALKFSRDGGRTWPEHVEVANDPSGRLMYWDQHHALGDGGHSLAVFWTYDRSQRADAPIRLSRSMDHGRTWSRPEDTGIAGQVAHPILFPDGRLLLSYVDRFRSPGIRVVRSGDHGRTFGGSELVLYEHRSPACNAGAASNTYFQDMSRWSFGRIEGVADSGSEATLVFYAGGSAATDIRWVRVRW